MKKNVLPITLAVCLAVTVFQACKRELSCEGCLAGNQPPVACAGPDQAITLPNNNATLDGSCSTDPENDIVSYTWSKISGPGSFSLTAPNVVRAQISNLVEGIYRFGLQVTDAGGLSAQDTVQVTVSSSTAPDNCSDTPRLHIKVNVTEVGTLSQSRSHIAVAAAGNKILFAGGSIPDPVGGFNSQRVDIYDVSTNTWSRAEFSRGRGYGIAALGVGDQIFFAGGEVSDGTFPTDAVEIYNTTTNTWTVEHLSLGGEDIATAAVGDKILFAGGMGGFSGYLPRGKRVDIYHLPTKSWTTAELSENKFGGHSAVTVNNKVYIAGGGSGDTWTRPPVSNTIDIYDNATGTWSTATMKEGKSGHAGIVVGNTIYWAGGSTDNVNLTCSVEMRNALSGSSTTQHLFSPCGWSISNGQNAVIKNNKIIFYGSGRSESDKFDIYDPASNTWTIGVLPFPVRDASIISVNNIVYLAGGFVNGLLSNAVWKLDF